MQPRNREIDDAFIVKRCGGSTGSAVTGEAQRVVRGRGSSQSHGMDRQGTWEILPLPAGKDAGEGKASENNPDPGLSPGLHGDGSPPWRTRTRQAPAEPAGETNKPKAMRGQEVVAP